MNFKDQAAFLSSIEPFSRLSRESLKSLCEKITEKAFSREDVIFSEGQEASHAWVLFKGRVRIYKYTSKGRVIEIESLFPGELFGTLCRLGSNGRAYPCTAVSAEKSVAFQIPDKVFLECYNQSQGFVSGVCSLCSDRLSNVQLLRCQGQESVPVRIASVLIRFSKIYGTNVPLTKREIAELAGTTVETAFRVIAQFQKKGALLSKKGAIEIKDTEKLRALLDSC